MTARGRPPAPSPARSCRPGAHLLPVCTVVTVVALGLRSPPTAETPEEADETKLQRVDGDIPKRKARKTVRNVIFGGGNLGKEELVA